LLKNLKLNGKTMDHCVNIAREYNRADKALASLRPANEAKHQIDYDRVVFLFPLAKPDSLPGAGDLIQHAAGLASGAIPHKMWRSLHSIGAGLKKRKLLTGDVIELRQMIELMKFLPVAADDYELSVQVTFPDCDVLAPDSKHDILSMLSHALEFMTRLRVV
jgi:hypothetical protein